MPPKRISMGVFLRSTTLFTPSLTSSLAALTLAGMGSRSRYPGSFGSRVSWGGMLTPAIRNIVIACTGVLLLQTVLKFSIFPVSYTIYFNHIFGLVPYYITRRFYLWQLVTYLFLHDGIWHLIFNMLFLYFFGVDLEKTWGTRRFYEYYFITGIGAGIITVLINILRDPHGGYSSGIPTIGASGAIFGVLIAAGIMFPDRQVWLIPFPIMIPMKLLVLGSIAIEFFLSLEVSGDTVSHITHLGGALVGYLYLRRGLFLYRFRNDYLDWKRRRARRKFEVYMREHKDEPPHSSDDRWVN